MNNLRRHVRHRRHGPQEDWSYGHPSCHGSSRPAGHALDSSTDQPPGCHAAVFFILLLARTSKFMSPSRREDPCARARRGGRRQHGQGSLGNALVTKPVSARANNGWMPAERRADSVDMRTADAACTSRGRRRADVLQRGVSSLGGSLSLGFSHRDLIHEILGNDPPPCFPPLSSKQSTARPCSCETSALDAPKQQDALRCFTATSRARHRIREKG